MDAIPQSPPGLPPHYAAPVEPVPSRIVAPWPTETFIENLIALQSGAGIVSILRKAQLDKVSPSRPGQYCASIR